MDYKIKSFTAKPGECFSQLYNTTKGCFPLFYPTAYTSRNLRGGLAHGTQKNYLHAIKKLYEWLQLTKTKSSPKGIDIHNRLLSGENLSEYEVDSLAT